MLLDLERLLNEAGEPENADRIRAALSSKVELEQFLRSNELWGGSGSIADQAGIPREGGRTELRRKIEAVLADLGGEQIRLGCANPRTASWVSSFVSWAEDDI